MGDYLAPHQTLTETPKRTVRIILHADFTTPSAEMFKELSWLPIVKRLKYNKTYKATNNLTFQYITDLLKRSSVDGALAVPRSRSSLFDRSYSYTASKLWNSIPIPIRNASSLTSFEDRIKSISINSSLRYFVSIFHFLLN